MILKSYKQELINHLVDLYDQREARQIVERLIEEKMGLSRADQVLEANEPLSSEQLQKLEQAGKELKKGRPLDYILGKSLFYGWEFEVDESVLIPRPETEELVQYILDREQEKDISIFDIGTGSGCIPIALKLEGKYNQVAACEVSTEALEFAKKNARLLDAEVELSWMDILKEHPKKRFDVVISNPPYVFEEEIEGLEGHVKEYEPLIALTPGKADPLLFYKRILQIMPHILKKGGRIYFEIHEEMGEKIDVLMRHHGLKEVMVVEDIYGRDRIASGLYAL